MWRPSARQHPAANSRHTAPNLQGATQMQPRSGKRSAVPAANRLGGASAPPDPPGPQAWMSDPLPADPDPRFDPSVPHSARVYSYWLGGKDHYPADRQAAEEVIRHRPHVVAGARANRAFLARVVRYLAA